MKKNIKGFSTLEIVVITGLISVLVILFVAGCNGDGLIVLPDEREEQVKANIHEIQVALERYAVDSGGFYPAFLIGAEKDSNIIKSYVDLQGNGASMFPNHGLTPFAMVADPQFAIGPNNLEIMCDPLIEYGYMSEYPTNPFTSYDNNMWQAVDADPHELYGIYPYGGLHGDRMFDLGFGWGDTPQTDFILDDAEVEDEVAAAQSGGTLFSDPDLDAPGNFYYHPLFEDSVPVYFHYSAKYGEVFYGQDDWSFWGITSQRVTGYLLYGYGSPNEQGDFEELGLDLFNRMPERDDLPDGAENILNSPLPVFDTSVGVALQARAETTGYSAFEYDPWTGGTVNGENASGPDGVPDWVIISVSSGVGN